MLYKGTVESSTFSLLEQLMNDSRLGKFNLAGGTAIALYLGHRKSIDLDLFTPDSFNVRELEDYLRTNYDFKTDFTEKDTLKGSVNGVKLDCITYNYPNINKLTITNEGIRIYSIDDIVAMKLSAIAHNGTRLKDFIDIACLSTRMSFNDMLAAYGKKFPGSNSIIAAKGIEYYADINFNDKIEMINGNYKWDMIEKRLHNMVKRGDTIFHGLPIEENKINMGRGLKL